MDSKNVKFKLIQTPKLYRLKNATKKSFESHFSNDTKNWTFIVATYYHFSVYKAFYKQNIQSF